MSMGDWGWDDDDQGELPQATTLLQPGLYLAEVRSAKWQRRKTVPEKWLGRNPDGHQVALCLSVVTDGAEHVIYADVPRHWRWRFEQISEALGVPMPDSPDWQPTDWVGKHVKVKTEIYNGQRVDVKEFRRASAPAAAAPQPRDRRPNTGAAKVAAARGEEAGGADEIPFMWLVPFLLSAFLNGGFV